MLGLKQRQLSPQQEAQRQVEIADEVERQKERQRAFDRDLRRAGHALRQQVWQDRAQAVEDKRMEAFAAETQKKRDQEAKAREQEAKANAEKMRVYREAKAEVDDLDRQLAQLNRPNLTPLEAAERVGLKELRDQADRRLIQAERAVGRHRTGGW